MKKTFLILLILSSFWGFSQTWTPQKIRYFDTTIANLIVGVCITTGLADVITIQMVKAEAKNL